MPKDTLKAPTPIATLGEFGLIERIKASSQQTKHSAVICGIGDDAAVLQPSQSERLLCKDMFCAGVHFDPSYMPLPHIGYKAVVACLSDIAAMNGLPEGVLIGLGLSSKYSVEAVEAIYQGITAACKDYGVALLGGDTIALEQGLLISVSATGTTQQAVYRTGAQAGDSLCVSGDLGAAYVGLQVLRREQYAAAQDPELSPYAYEVGRQLKPKARLDLVACFAQHHLTPTAMIDISDGLFSEILHLTQGPNLGAVVYEEHLPIASSTSKTALELNLSPTTCACHGGEDYELLFTLPLAQAQQLAENVCVIGEIVADNTHRFISKEGDELPITAQGWQHFQAQ